MMMKFRLEKIAVCTLAAMALTGVAHAQISMSALNSFGTNGWLAPGAQGGTFPTTDGNNRSMTFDPLNGQVLVQNGTGVRRLNATTGNNEAFLDMAGVSGGALTFTRIAATRDGQIFGTNLVTGGAGYRIYRWANADATASVVFNGNPNDGTRFGDNFAVSGTGNNVRMVAGAGTGVAGFASFSYDGNTTTSSFSSAAGSAAGDFRLGTRFLDNDTIVGVQNATNPGLRVASFGGTLLNTVTLADPNERSVAFASINGFRLMATIQTNSNAVRLYDITGVDMTTTASLTPLFTLNNTTSLNGNGNASSDITFGAISGNKITLYALNTNNGVQAFEIEAIPEPMTLGALALGLGALAARRRRKQA